MAGGVASARDALVLLAAPACTPQAPARSLASHTIALAHHVLLWRAGQSDAAVGCAMATVVPCRGVRGAAHAIRALVAARTLCTRPPTPKASVRLGLATSTLWRRTALAMAPPGKPAPFMAHSQVCTWVLGGGGGQGVAPQKAPGSQRGCGTGAPARRRRTSLLPPSLLPPSLSGTCPDEHGAPGGRRRAPQAGGQGGGRRRRERGGRQRHRARGERAGNMLSCCWLMPPCCAHARSAPCLRAGTGGGRRGDRAAASQRPGRRAAQGLRGCARAAGSGGGGHWGGRARQHECLLHHPSCVLAPAGAPIENLIIRTVDISDEAKCKEFAEVRWLWWWGGPLPCAAHHPQPCPSTPPPPLPPQSVVKDYGRIDHAVSCFGGWWQGGERALACAQIEGSGVGARNPTHPLH